MGKVYSLKIIDLKEETKNSVLITFKIPNELYSVFKYDPGQYITLQFNLKGQQIRRSYSLCSSPFISEYLQICIKRVKDGLVSNHINDTLKKGDYVEVLPPEGYFLAKVNKDNYKTYYLFAAGSGITPIISILKTVLHTEERSYVYMIYGNTNQETIMFREELKLLEEKYKNRFVLIQTLSRPKSSWSDLWKVSDKTYRKGRVDATCINWFINTYPPYAQNTEYYVCGPGKMIDNTVKTLEGMDVPFNRIFIESFGGAIMNNEIETTTEANLIVNLKGEKNEIIIPKGKTVLRALLDENYSPPYSCEGGVCATCKCKVIKGKVAMLKNLALTEQEVENGYVLSCQSYPLTSNIEIIYN
ncbi:ring-1,2-phenylacetyl-CoA epoxidase subunit PaaE [Tenacibaculum sp. MAR_2010_89]|uniref:2Fe-2S iron-sulfur cluster-binding protein n=1 Tax=Tenacibaculum sp. MAR_2010_89 TaxID=1250198 RepID=UPI00089D24C4|nr:2Fe-2S iron-sulfur cluster-binding protein [Tenacibaculum sp. MAR_2010_89]SEE59416.1 ring-1,2-phenylacetyl-CoA epoxidase subunit PaaE [Tenacibaculum sp. MAR_2010_89]